jgi:hypothetical protein
LNWALAKILTLKREYRTLNSEAATKTAYQTDKQHEEVAALLDFVGSGAG